MEVTQNVAFGVYIFHRLSHGSSDSRLVGRRGQKHLYCTAYPIDVEVSSSTWPVEQTSRDHQDESLRRLLASRPGEHRRALSLVLHLMPIDITFPD